MRLQRANPAWRTLRRARFARRLGPAVLPPRVVPTTRRGTLAESELFWLLGSDDLTAIERYRSGGRERRRVAGPFGRRALMLAGGEGGHPIPNREIVVSVATHG
jgi:hypothetical protein